MRGWALDFLSEPWPALTFGLLVLVALLVHQRIARSLRWPRWATLGGLLSLAVVLTLTMPPGPGARIGSPGVGDVGRCVGSLSDTHLLLWAVTATTDRGERVGNILMFVPVTFFAVLASRRPIAVAAAGIGLSAGVELAQSVLNLGRDCVGYDLVNNGIGAVLGVLVGVLAAHLVARRRPAPEEALRRD